MGSMTGAPKVEVMKNIEAYEDQKRGLYSGSVGYFTSEGDFDLNVVIRSIFYNAATHYLSIQVGGAITYDADADAEYQEMLLKAKGMLSALGAESWSDYSAMIQIVILLPLLRAIRYLPLSNSPVVIFDS
jgi:para-aminobenzoate synthetase component 1